MYIHVRILGGYPKPLTYAVPASAEQAIRIGILVRVPLRNRVVPAVVIAHAVPASTAYAIRDIVGIEPWPADEHYHAFITTLSAYYHVDVLHTIKRMRQFLTNKKVTPPDDIITSVEQQRTMPTLTDEQQAVYSFIAQYIHTPRFTPTVLHGITGSGKTEVYKKLIQEAIANNRTVMLLLPEVTLALQFERLLRAQLPSTIAMYGFHSATGMREKKYLWRALIEHHPILIIGVHLPVLLPIANLGLIIVDEEHETGYQEKKHPKINSKEAALMRAHKAGIPIVLGSATPSVSSLYNVATRGWHFFKLTKRFSGALPTIKTVLLTDKKQRRSFWISTVLEQAIHDRLAKHEQVIVFINRRGFSFFVQCTQCQFIFMCLSCSVSLTLHANATLTCHYCGYSCTQPSTCPQCSAHEQYFLKKGIGTQQVVSILESLFPRARIGRADLDTTTKKKQWAQILNDFEHGALDILVGTQTITKGYHFPRVTLVGILWADLNLNFPRYNASETTLQQLIQVAGRAGRERPDSLVIVQSMADHQIFQFLNEIEYTNFYEQEIAQRAAVGYPPCTRLIEIELKNTNERIVEHEATTFTTALRTYQETHAAPITILGPAKPPVHMIKNIHTRLIYMKGHDFATMMQVCTKIDQAGYKSSIFFTPNPVN